MLKVTTDAANEALESTVDEDLLRFEEYFRGLGNDPLVRSEKAILKTYLHYKLRIEGKGEAHGTPSGG